MKKIVLHFSKTYKTKINFNHKFIEDEYRIIYCEEQNRIKEFLAANNIKYSLDYDDIAIDEQEFDYLCLCFSDINFNFHYRFDDSTFYRVSRII